MLLLFITTFLVFLSYYSLFSSLKIKGLADKFVLIVLWASAQIIFTELMLGTFGWLYPVTLASINITLSSALLIWAKRRDVLILDVLVEDGKKFTKDCVPIITWQPNALLLALSGLITVWFVIASFLLPPRGVDDLGYHLPAIYQYVITH